MDFKVYFLIYNWFSVTVYFFSVRFLLKSALMIRKHVKENMFGVFTAISSLNVPVRCNTCKTYNYIREIYTDMCSGLVYSLNEIRLLIMYFVY